MSKPQAGTQINVRLDDAMLGRLDSARGTSSRQVWIRAAISLSLGDDIYAATVPEWVEVDEEAEVGVLDASGPVMPKFSMNASGTVTPPPATFEGSDENVTANPEGAMATVTYICAHSYIQAGHCLGCGQAV